MHRTVSHIYYRYKISICEGVKMAKNERFKRIYSQGMLNVVEIWVDKETGVNYVFRQNGYAGGLTPLLGEDGKPVVSSVF